jgi:hypothetical protein
MSLFQHFFMVFSETLVEFNALRTHRSAIVAFF